jgi:CDGSH-type Zn-finger protein
MNSSETKKSAEVTINHNGPIKVTGKFVITGTDGCTIQPANLNEVYFCACGKSMSKPFCDGSHKK